MPISRGGWKEAGLDRSPPRPAPTPKALEEMRVGKVTVMRHMYFDRRKRPRARDVGKDTPIYMGNPRSDAYEQWVCEFMVSEATKLEMGAGRKAAAAAGRSTRTPPWPT